MFAGGDRGARPLDLGPLPAGTTTLTFRTSCVGPGPFALVDAHGRRRVWTTCPAARDTGQLSSSASIPGQTVRDASWTVRTGPHVVRRVYVAAS